MKTPRKPHAEESETTPSPHQIVVTLAFDFTYSPLPSDEQQQTVRGLLEYLTKTADHDNIIVTATS